MIDREDPWFHYGKTWHEFQADKLNVAGTLMRDTDGKVTLIGHMNDQGGLSEDGYLWHDSEIVVAYRIVWRGDADQIRK